MSLIVRSCKRYLGFNLAIKNQQLLYQLYIKYIQLFLFININRYGFIINSEWRTPCAKEISNRQRCSHARNESASISFTLLNLLINFHKSGKYLLLVLHSGKKQSHPIPITRTASGVEINKNGLNCL